MARNSFSRPKFRCRQITLALAACFTSTLVLALPVGGQVVAGSASFSQTGNTLSVTNSNGTIINWQGFSIGSNEVTRFVQPSATSSVLNRVVTSDPSVLLGQLQSNGQVFLINPAGILVGAGARIDVASFVASSLQMSDADFLAKRFVFRNTPGAGLVRNEGTITTPTGGSVYLIGPSVENSGTITTPGGETILAAGKTVEIGDTATPGVRVEITGSDTQATNLGSIVADSGRIGMVGALVRNSGTLSASSAVSEGGRIFLRATSNIEQTAGGRIEASGTRGGQISLQSGDTTVVEGSLEATGSAGKGGQIDVLGDKVGLFGAANVDASGTAGGGTVLIGGDYQGANPEVKNAQITYMGPQAQIRADATQQGDGGRIIVWADDTTRAYGTISARGGSQGGDGGFVETSGKKHLDVGAITVDRSAPAGQAGTWLLDPSDVTFTNATENFNGGSFVSYPPGLAFEGANPGAQIYWSTITSNLSSGPVIISTVGGGGLGDIGFDSAYTYGMNTPNDLWLVANNHITIANTQLINSGTGDLKFIAGWTGASLPGTPWDLNAYDVSGANGSLAVSNAQVMTNGSIYVRTAAGVTVEKTNTAAAHTQLIGSYVSIDTRGDINVLNYPDAPMASSWSTSIGASGNVDIKLRGDNSALNLEASDGLGGGMARIGSGGNMHIDFTGGGANQIMLAGGNTGSPVNSPAQIWASGNQVIEQSGPGSLNITLTGGNATATGKDVPGVCSGCATGNMAEIFAGGSQTIQATNITLTGGAAGVQNRAGIHADGYQSINANSSVTLNGGTGGGIYVAGHGVDGLIGNDAEISSDFQQDINVGGNLTLQGGSAVGGVHGAFVVAPNQAIIVGGNVNVLGGSSGTPTFAGLGAAAVIGYDFGANLALSVGGSLTMTVGGSEGSAYLGALNNNASVLVNASGTVNLSGSANAAAAVGALQNSADADIGITGMSGIALNPFSKLLAGYGGSIVLDAGSGAISQAAADVQINALSLEGYGNGGVALIGSNNQVGNVSFTSTAGNINYVSDAPMVHVGNVSTSGTVTLTTQPGAIDERKIGLGTITGSSVNVSARNAILDDNGSGVANITANTITLSTVTGGNPGGIAISADVVSSGSVSANVPVAGGDGGIRIESLGASAPATLNLSDATNTGTGDIFFRHAGNLTTNGSYMVNSTSGSVIFGADGNLILAGGTFIAPAGVTLSAGGDMDINTNLSFSSDLMLVAGGTLTANQTAYSQTGKLYATASAINTVGGNLRAASHLFFAAANVSILGGGMQSEGGDLTANVAGNLDINGGNLEANGNLFFTAGNVNVDSGSIRAINGDLNGIVDADIRLTGGTLQAGNNVMLGFLGDSTLYLNELTGQPVSRVISGESGVVQLDFFGRSEGGVVIDGVPSSNTIAGASGFYNGINPAALGTGLIITYGGNMLSGMFLSDALSSLSGMESLYNGTDVGGTTSVLPDDTFADSGASSGEGEGEFGAESGTNKNGEDDEDKDKRGRHRNSACR